MSRPDGAEIAELYLHVLPVTTHNTVERRKTTTMATNNDKIQFRGRAEKQAAQLVDKMRLGGINVSELARRGLEEKLRETLSDEEKMKIHQQYERDQIPEEVAEVLIGDGLEEIQREKEAFADAMELDASGAIQE